MYKLLEHGVQRLSDGASIPEGPARFLDTLDDDGNVVGQVEVYDNMDWAEYQKWLKVRGNKPEPYVPEPAPVAEERLTQNEIARLRAFLATQP